MAGLPRGAPALPSGVRDGARRGRRAHLTGRAVSGWIAGMTAVSPFPADAFDPAAAPADLLELNARLRAEHARRADPWDLPVAEVRRAREEGRGIFPAAVPDPDTVATAVDGPAGPVPVRIVVPKTREARGTFLHIHGGGWIFGQAVEYDVRLRRLAETAGVTTVSIDYRLAPENPFPAPQDDCLAVARALLDGRIEGAPATRCAIGGESAGAHLAVTTLLSLRDEDGARPFAAANLVAGLYDLSMTPSAHRFGEERLIINTRDIAGFVHCAVPEGMDLRDPLVSPLFADLSGLPPARFSVGTEDLLLDDTLFMAARLAAAGNAVEIAVTPGGCHVFEAFGTPTGLAANEAANAFIARALDAAG